MRTASLLIASLALILGACSSKKSTAPPFLDKNLLNGKWKNVSQVPFFAGWEFGNDGTVKMIILDVKDPIPGQYTWSGDRTLVVEYSKEADVKKTYEAAAKAYKDGIKERISKKKMDGKAARSMLGAVEDKLPEKETYTVEITDPHFLVLNREGGTILNFEKAD
jgi:hypothetical protein